MIGTDSDALGRQFEGHRAHLRSVAYRMLGVASEADDAVQEAWIRLSRTDATTIDNLGSWLTTVVARICLDALRARKSRREEPIAGHAEHAAGDPESALTESIADSLGPALRIVLETLGPTERVAFVLHDMFGVSFDDIAAIVGRTPAAARQLASRARRRVQGEPPIPAGDREHQRELVAAFLAASREGSFEALLAVLDPDVVVHADRVAVSYGAQPELRGAAALHKTFASRARGATPVVIAGVPQAAWIVDGAARVLFAFTIEGDKITEIELLAEPSVLAELAPALDR